MPVLVKSGRAAIASAIKSRPIHLALGTSYNYIRKQSMSAHKKAGIEDLSTSDKKLSSEMEKWWRPRKPSDDNSRTTLGREIGRRELKRSQFVIPDAKGDIVVSTGVDNKGKSAYQRYKVSKTPTPHLHVEFQLDFEDGGNHAIRESALFIDTEVNSKAPKGARFLLPEHLKSKGTMLLLDHFKTQHMSGDIRETFEFVITF